MPLEAQYNKISRYFKNTSEAFDKLEWDSEVLEVILNDKVIERYTFEDLKEVIIDL